MRRFLSLLGAVLLAAPVFGQNTLTIHQKDGQQFSFGFDEKPVISFTDTELVLKTTGTELQYALASLAKFTFADAATGVDAVKEDLNGPIFTLQNYAVSITGSKSGINVKVISNDGKPVASYKTDEDGNVSFSISELPSGIYIINSENLTFKVLKK